MTPGPDPALDRFLQNAALLIAQAAADAALLQAHLGQAMECGASMPHPPDLVLLQSLDRMTQVLGDVAAALDGAAAEVGGQTLQNWPQIAARLGLGQVVQTLQSGGGAQAEGGIDEIF
ncbi:hypothetical protein [Paracoccus jeotgali]|uniref:Uncharacterized protein n=1 Tax=Paracoccus jeotgali TaxID=2065379 RepID=A0A2K9MCA8_9RHOB|nr:hypothetical protein [Paracoccus jeotgali]AUM73281.1 hypothetical protein CYR75_02325 [Paracoccus jeotgali]